MRDGVCRRSRPIAPLWCDWQLLVFGDLFSEAEQRAATVSFIRELTALARGYWESYGSAPLPPSAAAAAAAAAWHAATVRRAAGL